MINKIKQYLIKNKHKTISDVSFGVNSRVSLSCFFEGKNVVAPNTSLMNSSVGLATYISGDCKLNKIKIGRFCSIGQNVVNDVGRHPSSIFVSTHPCFFSSNSQAGFTFSKENIFDEHLHVDDENLFYVEVGNDVWIGNNVTLWSGNIIGHHCKIEDHCFITSGVVVGGNSKIGEGSFIGLNSSIKDGLKIGKNCAILMASAISRNMSNESSSISKISDIFEKENKSMMLIKKKYFNIK